MSPAKLLGPSATLAAVAEDVSGVLTVSQPGARRKPGKSTVGSSAVSAVPSAAVVGGIVLLRGIEVPADDERSDELQAVARTTRATADVIRLT
jgi:hypothetical protein